MPCLKDGTPLSSGVVEDTCMIRLGEPTRVPKQLLHLPIEEQNKNLLLATSRSNNSSLIKEPSKCRDVSI
jgi:hypothetical protein